MIVCGDPSYQSGLADLRSQLRDRVAGCIQSMSIDAIRECLILAGQLEQAAADLDEDDPGPVQRDEIKSATDALADALVVACIGVEDGRMGHLQRADAALRTAVPPARVTVRVPEGFAFYSLYPEQYALAASRFADGHPSPGRAVIIGVRSGGTTLSAVVAAALRARGWTTRRLTLPPSDDPVDPRHGDDLASALQQAAGGEHFLIVDDGGSTVAVVRIAQTLLDRGLPAQQIRLFPGRTDGLGRGVADDARETWRQLASSVIRLGPPTWSGRSLIDILARRTRRLRAQPIAGVDDLSAGAWRWRVFESQTEWPAACIPFERTKLLFTLGDGSAVLWKFTGLCNAGDSWPGGGTALGFTDFEWCEPRPRSRALSQAAPSPEIAFDIGQFLAEASRRPLATRDQAAAFDRLERLLVCNTREAVGDSAARTVQIACDAARRYRAVPLRGSGCHRPEPHEWRLDWGQLITASPPPAGDLTAVGPQPLTWDVAGVLGEWCIDGTAAPTLIDAAGCGSVPAPLLHFHRLAYAAFRHAQCDLCARFTDDPPEQTRLRAAAMRYRVQLQALIRAPIPQADGGAAAMHSSRLAHSRGAREAPAPIPLARGKTRAASIR